MRSLVEVLEDAVGRSAFEVILGSAHAIVFTTPWGRELERRVSPGAELFEMLSAVISDEQQIELAVGNNVALTLEARATSWTLRAKSGTEGISIHAHCPALAEAAAERIRTRADESDVPLHRLARPSSASLVHDTGEFEQLSSTSGQPFDDCWIDDEDPESGPSAAEPDPEAALDEDGAPDYVSATDSAVQGLPRFDELPDDAAVLVPEAWVQAEEIAKAAKRARALARELEPNGRSGRNAEDGERDVDELHARLAEQARAVTSLQLELSRYKRALARHDKAIRQLHKRLLAVEDQGPESAKDPKKDSDSG